MKFVLLSIASSEEKWAKLAKQIYLEKISYFNKIEAQHLQHSKISRDFSAAKIKAESALILNFLQSDDFVILLDEKGKSLDSMQFAKQIEKIQLSGKKRCVWIIGGAFGVSPEVKSRAQLQICLAPFILNHILAEIVLLEQIYRSFTIIKNLPYHNN